MKLSDLPHFTIEEVRPAPNDAEAHPVGRLSHLECVRIDAGCLYRPEGPSVFGTLNPEAGEGVENDPASRALAGPFCFMCGGFVPMSIG